MSILPVEPHKNPWFIIDEHISPAFSMLTRPSANFPRLTLATTKEKKANECVDHVRNVQVAFYLISFLSLAVLASLTITGQQESMQVQKELIDAAFGVICLLGIVAGISPSRCNRLVGHIPTKETAYNDQRTPQEKANHAFRGHHPDCGSFSSHIIQIGGRTYCAGCAGLVIGATIALIGTVFYVLLQSISTQLVTVTFWSGLVGVTLGLLQYTLFTKRASIHFLLNVVFVIGAFLLLVGVTEMNGSLSVGTYFLLVILFLINVRSTLSRLEHRKKCITCSVEYCSTK